MYKKVKYLKTDLCINDTREGETIEVELERLKSNKEPIPQEVPYIGTEVADGVLGIYNVRHDAWDEALDELTQIHSNSAQKYAEDMAKLNQKLQGGAGDTSEGDASEA